VARMPDRNYLKALRLLKPLKTGSSPVVVPGAAPALAKSEIGGY